METRPRMCIIRGRVWILVYSGQALCADRQGERSTLDGELCRIEQLVADVDRQGVIAVGALGAMMLPKNSEAYQFTNDAANTIKQEAEKAIQSMSN